MDFSTYDNQLQVVTSSDGEIVVFEDSRFPWREKKVKTVTLAKLYQKAGYPEYSRRAATCATSIQCDVYADGTKKVTFANFCHLRLCPMCIARRAKRAAYKLSRVLDRVEAEHAKHEGVRFVFLTLTVRNVPGDQLGDALGQLTNAWVKLIRHRQFERSIGGWFRAVEITRGDNRWHKDHKTGAEYFRADKGYHPHIHAILAVPPEYFVKRSGLYITQAEWVEHWQRALGVDYKPSVRIQVSKAKGEYSGGCAAAIEAAKYAVKDEDYIDDTLPESRLVEILRDYTEALRNRRLTAYGGWLKAAAKALDAENLDDGDLVHVEEETIREDVAELISRYNWHFGAGDYILTSRQINPLKLITRGAGA